MSEEVRPPAKELPLCIRFGGTSSRCEGPHRLAHNFDRGIRVLSVDQRTDPVCEGLKRFLRRVGCRIDRCFGLDEQASFQQVERLGGIRIHPCSQQHLIGILLRGDKPAVQGNAVDRITPPRRPERGFLQHRKSGQPLHCGVRYGGKVTHRFKRDRVAHMGVLVHSPPEQTLRRDENPAGIRSWYRQTRRDSSFPSDVVEPSFPPAEFGLHHTIDRVLGGGHVVGLDERGASRHDFLGRRIRQKESNRRILHILVEGCGLIVGPANQKANVGQERLRLPPNSIEPDAVDSRGDPTFENPEVESPGSV